MTKTYVLGSQQLFPSAAPDQGHRRAHLRHDVLNGKFFFSRCIYGSVVSNKVAGVEEGRRETKGVLEILWQQWKPGQEISIFVLAGLHALEG